MPGISARHEERVSCIETVSTLGIAMDTKPMAYSFRSCATWASGTRRTCGSGLEAMKARRRTARSVPLEELRGQTITLSNFGMHGGRHAALVVLPPQVAILGAGRIGRIACRRHRMANRPCIPVLPLSLTFDHRVGHAAARLRVFFATVHRGHGETGREQLPPENHRTERPCRTLDRFADDLGPSKIVEIYEPSVDLRATVVVDNVAAGPAIGGLRMAPDVTVEECFRLARAMTFKNAAAGLPHGGGKSVIAADPGCPQDEKAQLIRAFACAIKVLTDYIPGPDMGTNETCMAWIHDEIGRSVGLPPELGGIPLDVIGTTGYGLAVAAEAAEDYCDVRIDGARVAVQGFGSVGRHAARFLLDKGAVLVAAADSRGTVADPAGLDVDALIAFKEGRGHFDAFEGASVSDRDAIVETDCDIWIPAARPDVIRADNVERVKARLVVQGANIPVTEEAERQLAARGVLSLPDFIANAGGVICAAVEYAGGSEAAAFMAISEKVGRNTRAVLEAAKAQGVLPRQAAIALAEERVRAAMAYRRW